MEQLNGWTPPPTRSACLTTGKAWRAKQELEGGDVVALYTDGVSEALHVSGKEFGAEGVVETLRAQESAGAQAVLDRAIKAVLDFTQGEQHDDITMLVATVA